MTKRQEPKGLIRKTPLRSKTTPIKRKPTKKKVPTTTLRRRNKKKCSDLFSKIIKARDKECAECGATAQLQCAHLLRRSQGDWTYTRLDNAVTLCQAHHTYFTHHEPEWGFWIDDHFGRGYYFNLKLIAREGVGKKFDWAMELKRLETVAKELGIK